MGECCKRRAKAHEYQYFCWDFDLVPSIPGVGVCRNCSYVVLVLRYLAPFYVGHRAFHDYHTDNLAQPGFLICHRLEFILMFVLSVIEE